MKLGWFMTLSERRVNQLIGDNLPMPSNVRKIKGNIIHTDDYTHGESWSAIEIISGYLSVRNGCKLNLSALTSIGSSLYLEKCSHVDLPVLTSIGGDLHLTKDAHVDLPVLTSIGFNLTLKEGSHADLSALTSIGGELHIDNYTEPLPTQLRHLETREKYKLIYQAEEISNQVISNQNTDQISSIKRKPGI